LRPVDGGKPGEGDLVRLKKTAYTPSRATSWCWWGSEESFAPWTSWRRRRLRCSLAPDALGSRQPPRYRLASFTLWVSHPCFGITTILITLYRDGDGDDRFAGVSGISAQQTGEGVTSIPLERLAGFLALLWGFKPTRVWRGGFGPAAVSRIGGRYRRRCLSRI
jgi:hypothetical protein